MTEAKYQKQLMNKLTALLPGCVIIKNDPRFLQGVPDLLILFNDRWAILEVKMSSDSERRPNQEYYVEMLNDMSFASFICPENEEAVLSDLQHALGASRETRIS